MNQSKSESEPQAPWLGQAVVVLTTVDSEKEATRMAHAFVEARLAACVNIIPKITSVYEWKKEVCEEQEVLLIIKTQKNRIEELKALLSELHPYDVPELIVLPVIDGLPDYLNWLFENTQ